MARVKRVAPVMGGSAGSARQPREGSAALLPLPQPEAGRERAHPTFADPPMTGGLSRKSEIPAQARAGLTRARRRTTLQGQ